MSKFSDVYDTLRTRVATLFPNKTLIPYAYSLIDNPNVLLKDGYGFKVGSGSDGETSNDFESTVNRSISIVFTSEVLGFNSIESTDLITKTKAIIDDMYTLKDSLLDLLRVSPMLGGEIVSYSGDSGIEDIGDGKQRFISLEVAFNFEMVQNINQ